ncbi:CoA transferase [Kallotenue papyrolyticum]|uniref:CoA transferase n=1 Tax=Kallotenue papyrolyticum TaxID=1325125 RepID=UPI0004926F29|nr:CaiB/BaiF CoA-transferase family protein [Kallotenue papyrolyticum]
MRALDGWHIVNLAINLPGPWAAARLQQLGARVTKVEPPDGDPLARICPPWYAHLSAEQRVLRLDLKAPPERERLAALLDEADLLLTAMRPRALARLGLDWAGLQRRYPRLCQVAIVGAAGAQAERPGHDLTYQAQAGLLTPPALPRALLADLAGAERAVSAALALLLVRARGGPAGYAEVALADTARELAAPWRYGLTQPDGPLGGGWPGYGLYPARVGWVALAALEPRFWQRLTALLGLSAPTHADLARIFATRDAAAWARERDLPLVAVEEGTRPAGEGAAS